MYNDKQKKKRKGFTLIELLAVIIILGILMIIAVPSVTKYIGDTRRNSYVNTAKEIINGGRNLAHSGNMEFTDPDATYYVPSTCVKIENHDPARSPYGLFDPAYVIINYDSENAKYDYYWMSRDETGMGVKTPIKSDDLGVDNIENNIKKDEFNSGITTIDNRSKFVFYNDDCSSKTEVAASSFGTLLPVNECTFDGEMTRGAEFVNGQYTYRYMQEGNGDTEPENLWTNIDDDGWGVILTDKNSTDPVNTNICTSINGKPIVSMSYMFYTSRASSIDVSSFDTSHVKSMLGMFSALFNVRDLNLSYLDTAEVVNNSIMFSGSSNLESVNMDNWNMRKLGSNGGHFGGCTKLKTVSAKNWKVPQNLTSWISWSWGGASSPIETIDVTGWDLSQTKSINGLFGGSSHLKNIIGLNTWNTSNLEDIGSLFTACSSLKNINLSNFNTSKVTNMGSMFSGCTGLESVNLSSFDTSKVINMGSMFSGCTKLENINLSNFNTQNVENMNSMFYNTRFNNINLSNFNTNSVIDMSYMFANNPNITSIDLSSFRTPNLENYGYMFSGCSNLGTVNLSNWDVTNAGVGYNVFSNCDNLKEIVLDNWKISESFTYFTANTGINDLYLDFFSLYNWDLSNTTDLSSLFEGGTHLSTISGIQTWNTSNVENMSRMFMFTGQYVSSFILNVSTWDTRNVTDMSYMFSYSGQQAEYWFVGTLDNWNVSKVENMTSMFDGAGTYSWNFNIGNLTNWDTRNVTNMYAMFYGAGAYSSDYWGNMGTLKIYADNIYAMFGRCGHAKVILNIYNNPSYYDSAFYGASTANESGIVVNYTSNVTDIDNIIATKYSASNVTKGSLIS